MEFFLFVCAVIGFLMLYVRQGVTLRRLDDIDIHLRGAGRQAQRPPEHAFSQPALRQEVPPHAPSEGAQGVQDGARVASSSTPMPAPAPAPTPLSDYFAASVSPAVHDVPKVAFADEAQEEKSARWLGRIGGMMVFLGMIFFVNFAIQEGWLTPAGQFILGILVGIIMLVIGHALRTKHLDDIGYQRFSMVLLGGGIAVLYLIIYAGFSILHYENGSPIISQLTAFMLMILVTVATMVLSVVSNSRFLAISAVVGGFLTPVMVSTGENNLVTLALYITLLNLGVMGMGWFKKWSWLNFLAMFGTVMLFGGWMERFYWSDPDSQFSITFIFLTVFFFQFLITAVLHHFRSKVESTLVDLVYLTLNAGLYFSASYAILEEWYGDFLGFFALLLALVHLCVAYISYVSTQRDRRLNLFLVGVAVVFLSIAIPLQLSGYWISLSWLVESVVLIGIGAYLREHVLRIFGWILFALGMVSVMNDVAQIRGYNYYQGVDVGSATPFFNSAFLMLVMAVCVTYAIGYMYARFESGTQWKKVLAGMVIVANLLTLYSVTSEIGFKYDNMIRVVRDKAQTAQNQLMNYQGNAQPPTGFGNRAYSQPVANGYLSNAGVASVTNEIQELQNQKSTAQSIFWALYAILLLSIGFMRRIRALRIGGLILIFITATRVFFMVWGFGELYRIVASLVFGVLALVASFIYVKYKHLLKEIIYEDKQ